MFYSKSTNGFYDGGDMPGDAKEIAQDAYQALFTAQAQGKVIKGDAQGYPVAVNPTPPGPAPVPTSVTMRQARLALLAANKLSPVSAAMADAPEAVRIDWEFAATVDRDSSTVALMSQALNLTAGDLDGLFTAAAKL